MVKSPTKLITLEDFLKLPETKPASEYINGQIIQKPMPQGKHSILQGELVSNINSLVKPQKIALAFPELRCTFGGRSIVPDVAVFAWERIPLDEGGDVANVFKTHPDWTIEILSPEQSQTKVTGNILHCLKHGSKLGWLIDPGERCVLVFPPNQQPELLQEEQQILPVLDLVSGLQLTLGQLFGWLKL
ncbi:hypothetical protein NIES25_19740 [Nostoc linckia NIES-25]|nr:hypothetical protein NIES25_19740 [Nostoc linckia NIES-25]